MKKILLLLLLSSAKICAQKAVDIKLLKIIKWDLGEDVNWDNYDPSQIKFTCESLIVNDIKDKRRITKKLTKRKAFKGKLGAKVCVKYSLEILTEGKIYQYRILNNGFIIHERKKFCKIPLLLSKINRVLENRTLLDCECPIASK